MKSSSPQKSKSTKSPAPANDAPAEAGLSLDHIAPKRKKARAEEPGIPSTAQTAGAS